MNGIADNFIGSVVQCYGCPIFDRLFQVVSTSAAVVYDKMAFLATLIFCVLFAFFVINAVWQNIKKDVPDPFYQKSVRPVIINSLVALTFLWAGVGLPRIITTATFEPVAQISLIYTQSMLNIDDDFVNEHVTYKPMPMEDNGFFTIGLRDKVIMLMKTTITQFQSYMKLGIAVMDSAFSWKMLLGIGALVKHILLLFVGMYIFWAFFKLFFRFCCYFADIIISMAIFAFFFPLSLVLIAFRGAENVPSWISGLGKDIGIGQFKTLINSIIALVSAVITYTVVMVIIAKFFATPDTSVTDIMNAITTENIFSIELSDDNIAAMSIMGIAVLAYVVNFLTDKKLINQVTDMVLSAFNVKAENKLSEQLADDAMRLTSDMFNVVKTVGSTAISAVTKKDGKKEDKK